MKSVQPFIDLGWHVVPIDNVIKRGKDGKKTRPKMRGMWKELYLDTPYDPEALGEAPAVTGAVITGKLSGVVSIDCDTQETYDIFKALDPNYDFVFMSKDKKAGGGSIMYVLADSFSDIPAFNVRENNMELDYQTDEYLQYLPTVGNKSKVEWEAESFEDLPELREPPETVINYLRMLYTLKNKSKAVTRGGGATNGAVARHYKNLAPFVDTFVTSGKFAPDLFRILTPRDGGFRELPQYLTEKTLHPDNVPDGMGNEYITKVAGVLVCDESVSSKLFKRAMSMINGLWSDPYPADKLESIVRHELNRPEWEYNKDWKEQVSVILTDYDTIVNVFYDPLDRIYYALDSKFGMSTFTAVDTLPKHLNSIVRGGRKYKTADIYDYLDKKRTILSPLEPVGDLGPADMDSTLDRYNLFARGEAYDVLLHPERYKAEYEGKVPEATVAYFEHLIPDEHTRGYVLRFVLTKLLTLNFSEVVLYFLGANGAGKNLFVDWLEVFTANAQEGNQSADYKLVIDVDKDNFLAKYNAWLRNALFANLDEYGEKTSGASEDRQVLAMLKSYTGKSAFQLRTMHTNPIASTHNCTFVLTANENRLSPDLKDRRIVLIDTPDALEDSPYVMQAGGKSKAIGTMFDEMPLWAYYWVTKYEQLSRDEYRTPPKSEFKDRLIYRHLIPSKRIVAVLASQRVGMIVEMFEDADMLEELISDAKYGVVSKRLLADLFDTMTSGGRKSMLDQAYRSMQIRPKRSRLGRRNVDAFAFPALKKWASRLEMTDNVLLSAELDELDDQFDSILDNMEQEK